MTMKNMKIVEQVKYYLFGMHVYTKTLKNGNPNLIDVLKNNKEVTRHVCNYRNRWKAS